MQVKLNSDDKVHGGESLAAWVEEETLDKLGRFAEQVTRVDVHLGDASAVHGQVVDKRCTLTVTGGLNRPPMERTKGIAALFAKARGLASELGVVLEESSTGGGSDGNFSAALGVPTLDGLGTVGEGAHAVNESILVDRIADRTALLAKLVAAL